MSLAAIGVERRDSRIDLNGAAKFLESLVVVRAVSVNATANVEGGCMPRIQAECFGDIVESKVIVLSFSICHGSVGENVGGRWIQPMRGAQVFHGTRGPTAFECTDATTVKGRRGLRLHEWLDVRQIVARFCSRNAPTHQRGFGPAAGNHANDFAAIVDHWPTAIAGV